MREGFVDVTGGRVWYRRAGDGGRTPLLILHGGPGAASYYVEPLAERLAPHRPTIVYDQLGCGLSERPNDPSLWTRERFAREVDAVREALGLDEVVLFGHSWGSVLAVDLRGCSAIDRTSRSICVVTCSSTAWNSASLLRYCR